MTTEEAEGNSGGRASQPPAASGAARTARTERSEIAKGRSLCPKGSTGGCWQTLLAHFDFLSRVLLAHGLPLALYVDYHSFFFTHTPDSFTQLGEALHFYGIALRYAPTPQAKSLP